MKGLRAMITPTSPFFSQVKKKRKKKGSNAKLSKFILQNKDTFARLLEICVCVCVCESEYPTLTGFNYSTHLPRNK